MDNTELHYVTYDPEALWEKMNLAYIEAGGDVLYGGSEKEMLLRGVQQILVQAFAGIDNGIRMATLRYAVRDYLKLLGEDRGCEYNAATPASATVEITFRSTGTAETIPAGEAVTADGVMLYTLDADLEDDGTARTVTARVTCSKAGAAGNGLLAGTAMQFMLEHDGVVAVTCTADAAGGQDDEDEEAYRERIRAKGLTTVTTGTEESYRSAAMAVSSVILDARPIRVSAGSVCVYMLLSDDTGAAALMAAVEAALNSKDTRPLTDNVSCALATKVEYTLNVQYTSDLVSAMDTAAAEAVAAYQKWQDNSIGRAFNPDKLVSLLYQAGATRVVFAADSEFDGGDVEYTEIDPSEVCSGTITLAVMSA